jgi:hypothetical protein
MLLAWTSDLKPPSSLFAVSYSKPKQRRRIKRPKHRQNRSRSDNRGRNPKRLGGEKKQHALSPAAPLAIILSGESLAKL